MRAAWRLTSKRLPYIDIARKITAGNSHLTKTFFLASTFCFFFFFILGKFNVYGRKLINNIHSLRHSLRSLILVIFVMSLNIKKNKTHKNTTIFFEEERVFPKHRLFRFFCLQSFDFGFISLANIRMLAHIYMPHDVKLPKFRMTDPSPVKNSAINEAECS